MNPGRIMGLDVGDKWIGVAVSDETGLLSRPESPVRRNPPNQDIDAILGLAAKWGVGEIVVGLPLNMNNTRGPQAEKTLRFAEALRSRFSGPVVTWDERLTTQQAERLLIMQEVRRDRRKKLVDGLAAALILQGYLDSLRGKPAKEGKNMANDDTRIPAPEDEDEIITLTDEEGNEHEFVVVDVIEVESKEYAILLPIDTEEDEEAEAVILRLDKDDDGDDVLTDIDSQEEWERVAQAYEELLEEDLGSGE